MNAGSKIMLCCVGINSSSFGTSRTNLTGFCVLPAYSVQCANKQIEYGKDTYQNTEIFINYRTLT